MVGICIKSELSLSVDSKQYGDMDFIFSTFAFLNGEADRFQTSTQFGQHVIAVK